MAHRLLVLLLVLLPVAPVAGLRGDEPVALAPRASLGRATAVTTRHAVLPRAEAERALFASVRVGGEVGLEIETPTR